MKPFNLQEALAGKPVITRDGRKVEQIVYLNKAQCVDERVVAIVDGVLNTYYETGHYTGNKENRNDLFMAPERREYWVNVYRGLEGVSTGQNIFESEKEAKLFAMNSIPFKFLTAVKVWEKEV